MAVNQRLSGLCKYAIKQQRDELVLIVDHIFGSSEPVYFCLSIPFTYQ